MRNLNEELGRRFTAVSLLPGPDGRTASIKRVSARATAIMLALAVVASGLMLRAISPARAATGISFRALKSAVGSGGTTFSVAKPSGVASGDVMLAAIYVRSSLTVTAPSGWSVVRKDPHGAIYSKVAGSSEPATYTWGLSADRPAAGVIVAYSGVDTSSPIVASSGQMNDEGTALVAPSVSAASGSTVVAFYGVNAPTAVAPPSGMVERLDVASAASPTLTYEVSEAAAVAAGSTGSKVASAGTAAKSLGQLVALRPAPSAPSGPYRPFSVASYWNTPLPSNAPIDPNSAKIIAWMKGDSTTNYINVTGATSSGSWGSPYYFSKDGDPTYSVKNTCTYKLPAEFASMRIPANAKPDTTSDASMVVIDQSKGLVYGLFQTKYDSATKTWSSCGGAAYYASSNGIVGTLSESDQKANWGHRGIPPNVFAVRYDEVQAGVINHVLKIAVNTTKCAHVFPMSGDECGTTAADAPPEGTRIRLKQSIDLSKYNLNAAQLTIARALQQYGAVIGDQSGGPASLKVENVVAEGRGDLWNGLLSSTSLSMFPLDAFEVIQLGYGG